jgi:cytochrome c peroxidase
MKGGFQAVNSLHVTRQTMLSSVVRSSLRSSPRLAARSAVPNRTYAYRGSGFRKYSTEAPKSSSNTLLWAGLGVAAAGGVAWYIYSSEDAVKVAETGLKSGVQSAKAAVNFVPTKEDYQKVRCYSGNSHLSHAGLALM